MEVLPDEYVETALSPLAHKLYWWGFALLISYGLAGVLDAGLLGGVGIFAITLVVGRLLKLVIDPRFVRLHDALSEWSAGRKLRRSGWTKAQLDSFLRPPDEGLTETVKGTDISS